MKTRVSQTWDAIIVGAGAAGLMAAASAGLQGRRVVVLEKNRKLGVKILMSGGTRCNITHNCDQRGIAEAFGRQGKFLRSALASLTPEQVVEKIEAQGVATKVEETGKIFPISNKAIDVRDALVRMARDGGATILTEQPVESVSIEFTDGNDPATRLFTVHTPNGSHSARNLILTTGGKSYPGCGTTGDGYAWAKQFGHSIVPTVPALAPVQCELDWIRQLKGITIQDVELSVRAVPPKKKQKPLDVRRGPLLFTHFGFSGPTAMNISRAITRFRADRVPGQEPQTLVIRCDFLPDITSDALLQAFRDRQHTHGKQSVAHLLNEWFPKRLADSFLMQADIPEAKKFAEFGKKTAQKLVQVLKQNDCPVQKTLGYKKAEVTAGGVALSEVDSRDMQSKLRPGLYFAGEILDIDGPIGGFNFQAAFSTGWLAGSQLV